MWPQDTPSVYANQVCFYHGIHDYPGQAYVAECLSVLQKQCHSACYGLSISTQQNLGGQCVTTVLTDWALEKVCASIASVVPENLDFTAVVIRVGSRSQGPMTINDVILPA